jgi:uncharacterized membrane protein
MSLLRPAFRLNRGKQQQKGIIHMRLTTGLALLAMATTLGNPARGAPAPTKYQISSVTLVDLGSLSSPDRESEGHDINDLGDVVGGSYDSEGHIRPMIHLGGQMYFLNPSWWPYTGGAYATSINNNRMVVGTGWTPEVGAIFLHGFYYYPGIWATGAGTNGHGLGFDWDVGANSVNNQNVVVGTGKIFDPPGLPDAPDTTGICYTDWLPMYWSGPDQNPQALFCYPDPEQDNKGFLGLRPEAKEINDSGYIVGTDGGKTTYGMFLKRASQSPVAVPRPANSPAFLFGSANSISNTGLVVGAYGYNSAGQQTSSVRAFIWDGSSATSTSLGALPGGNWSVAEGVNDQGMVVGTSERDVRYSGLGKSAFIYHADFGMVRLTSPTGGGLFQTIKECNAAAINNRKSGGLVQVAGTCAFEGHAAHAVRWDIQVAQAPVIQISP